MTSNKRWKKNNNKMMWMCTWPEVDMRASEFRWHQSSKKKKKICANIVFTCHIITFSVYFRLTQQIVYVAMSTFEFHVCVHMYAATSIYIVSLTHSLSSVYLFMSFALKFRPRYFSIQFQKGIYTLYVHCFCSAISMASELCEFQTVGLNSYCQTLIPMSIRWNTVPWIDDYCVCR